MKKLLYHYFFTLLLIPLSLQGAEYSLEPQLKSELLVDDNFRLTTLQNDTVSASRTEGTVGMHYETERTFLDITPSIQFNRFSEDIGLNVENYIIDVNTTHSLNTKTELGISASYRDEAIGRQEVNVTGLFFEEIKKESRSITPYVKYFLSDKSLVDLLYFGQKIEYGNSAARFGLQSFDYEQFNLNYSHMFTEQLTFGLALSHSTFEPGSTSETETNSAQISVNFQFDETLNFFAQGGMNESETETLALTRSGIVPISTTIDGTLYTFRVSKEFETITMNGSYSRSVSPGNLGDQNVRDSFQFNTIKRFTPKLKAKLQFNLIDNQTENNTLSANFRNFESKELRTVIDYRLYKNFTVFGGYMFRDVLAEGNPVRRESNQFFVTLQYDFDKITFTR